MKKRILLSAALAILVSAALLFFSGCAAVNRSTVRADFVKTQGSRFVVNGEPFRFVGANVAVMYRDEDRAAMPETLRQASQAGIRVVRVWAFGEGGPNDVGPLADFADWPRTHPFRWAPNQWNEEAFVHLDKVLVAAQANNLRVQLCLTNWWRDTGGVTQYLRWAGINDADDKQFPFGINAERAMLFYTNETTRLLYRQHLEKLATRRNSITGVLYRDDPTIFGWELMNEAQAVTGRWAERRAWLAEMSTYLKSLDANHIIAPGDWGYRTAGERREWLADHRLHNIDYCDVHNYPREDGNSFVDSTQALLSFVENRTAAAVSTGKPLVFGEFGMGLNGYNGTSQQEWFRAYFDANIRTGSSGAMFWILTPDSHRGFGVSYTSPRDGALFQEIKRASEIFTALRAAAPPERVMDPARHLVPLQFVWKRPEGDPATVPRIIVREDKSLHYGFKPQMASNTRFEKLGGGPGYIWGFGAGFVEYVIPAREDRRRVSQIIVRAHIQPVLPVDAKVDWIRTRVTLFVNGADCGSRLIPVERVGEPLIQEWRVDGFFVRLRAMRGLPLVIRFAVTPEADWPYGVNISNWPEGYDSHDAKPIEVEIRRQ
ncbi:MAG: cellulase family glycosylhydrolase [bacterium]